MAKPKESPIFVQTHDFVGGCSARPRPASVEDESWGRAKEGFR